MKRIEFQVSTSEIRFTVNVQTQFEDGPTVTCEVTWDDDTCLMYDDDTYAEYD